MVLPHDQLNNRGGNHLEWEAWKSTSPFTHAIPCADGGAFPENSGKNGTDGILASRIPYVQHSSKAYIVPKLLQIENDESSSSSSGKISGLVFNTHFFIRD